MEEDKLIEQRDKDIEQYKTIFDTLEVNPEITLYVLKKFWEGDIEKIKEMESKIEKLESEKRELEEENKRLRELLEESYGAGMARVYFLSDPRRNPIAPDFDEWLEKHNIKL
jgi:transposase-like protein